MSCRLKLTKGQWAIHGNGIVRPVNERWATLLLAVLFNRVISRDDVIEILWPDSESQPDWWGESLRCTIFKLGKELEHFGYSLKTRPGGRGMWELGPPCKGRRKMPEEYRPSPYPRGEIVFKRHAEIIAAKAAGVPTKDLARQYGFTKDWVNQLFKRWRRAEQVKANVT